MLEKSKKNPKSKNFACPGLNFERLANLGLNGVRLMKTGLNFEIPLSMRPGAAQVRLGAEGTKDTIRSGMHGDAQLVRKRGWVCEVCTHFFRLISLNLKAIFTNHALPLLGHMPPSHSSLHKFPIYYPYNYFWEQVEKQHTKCSCQFSPKFTK
jgi:hypothetical protein